MSLVTARLPSRPKGNTLRRAELSLTRFVAVGSSIFTSGQGVVYGVEQYYHAPGKCSTMVLEVAARALTKHALNVHCGHDDIYGRTGHRLDHAVLAKMRKQTADQALIFAPRDRAQPYSRHEHSGWISHLASRAHFFISTSRN